MPKTDWLIKFFDRAKAFLRKVFSMQRRLDLALGAISARLIFWSSIAFNFLLLVIISWFYFQSPLQTHFSAQVVTETFVVDVGPDGSFPQSLVSTAVPLERKRTDCETASTFEIFTPLEREIRYSFSMIDGEPSVLIQPKAYHESPYGLLICQNETLEVVRDARAYPFREGNARSTYVLEGIVQLGQVAGAERAGVLRSGEVIVSTASLPSRSARIEEKRSLMLGDSVHFFVMPQEPIQALSSIIVRYEDDDKAFHVVSHASAHSAEVKRLGYGAAIPITFAPSLWARFEAQSEWTLFALIVAIFLNVAAAVRSYSSASQIQIVEVKKCTDNSI